MTKRGEPLPINQALNRPRAKLGLDLISMDGDRIRLRNGFPRWVPRRGADRFPVAGHRRVARRPQTSEDVRTLGLEFEPEVLL